MRYLFLHQLQQLFNISQSHNIARRYFVVNGFDGALTTLGLLIGFYLNNNTDLNVAITACVSAAIALAMSGLSSAYVSETAERQREFREIQNAMVADISGSTHHKASRWMPVVIALVNGLSPLIISLVIIIPLWMGQIGHLTIIGAYECAIGVAFALTFLLGVFLSNVNNKFWLVSGLQTVTIAVITVVLIYLLT